MKIIKNKITRKELAEIAEKMFGNLVKGVVDTQKEIMAIDGELHADEEKLLLENGSSQEDLWGINLYPEIPGDDWVEFDSMINLRPKQGNRSRSVEDPKLRARIIEIVNKIVKDE